MSATPVLDEPTLVLNRNWQPIQVTSVRRALMMVCKDAARVVDPVDFQLYGWDEWLLFGGEGAIRASGWSISAPEVVALSRWEEHHPMRRNPYASAVGCHP